MVPPETTKTRTERSLEQREAKSRWEEGRERRGGGGGKLTLFRSYRVLAMVIRTPRQATEGVALLAAISLDTEPQIDITPICSWEN